MQQKWKARNINSSFQWQLHTKKKTAQNKPIQEDSKNAQHPKAKNKTLEPIFHKSSLNEEACVIFA